NNFYYSDSLRFNAAEGRLGIELEVGERYHFTHSAFGIEASLNYTNVNFFGKSYAPPDFRGSIFNTATNSINDGKNPNDPNDSPRVIDYISIRIVVRYYF